MIRIVLADDHKLFAEGVARIIAADREIVIEGVFDNGADLLQHLSKARADLALVDLNMPRMDGFEVIRRLRQVQPDCKVVVLSMYAEEEIFRRCEEAGIDGYLLKDAEPDELLYTIREVHEGRYLLNFNHIVRQTQPADFNDEYIRKYKLSKREVEIIHLLQQGLTNQEVAERIFLSVYTVQTHRRNIIEKLKVKNSAELMNLATKLGI